MAKKTKTPSLPLISSNFALLDIMKGRSQLEKIVGDGYRIPVTISGYIQNGRGGVGRDDGTSREFSIDVGEVVLRDPQFVPADKIGRAWALVDDLKAGDRITLDDDFTCAEKNKPRLVLEDERGLYFKCADGRHTLSAQIGEHGEYIGVYKVGK